MPFGRRTLTHDAVMRTSQALFEPSTPESFGVELEWPVHRLDDVAARPSSAQMAGLEGAVLPSGGRVTFEPGGQVELSTSPASSVADALDAADIDTHALTARLAELGLQPTTLAVDHRRAPRRVLQRPRYQAMEAFFAEQGSAGAWMMCNTASTQINLSHDQLDPAQRWLTMHHIAPVLIAAYANSPGSDASGHRWTSLRQAIWWSIDAGRTQPVPTTLDPASAWLHYALRADVMYIREDDICSSSGTAVRPGLSFGRWMSQGHPAGWPTIEDYHYHLSTLFPPVRPRGWLELRVLDALPDWIRDCATVTVAAACTNDAGQELAARLPDTSGLWMAAARDGLRHPTLAAASGTLFDVARTHLTAVTTDSRLSDQLGNFTERYVSRGRCPGDDPTTYGDDEPDPSAEPRTPVLTCA